jgi:hypothetical protein
MTSLGHGNIRQIPGLQHRSARGKLTQASSGYRGSHQYERKSGHPTQAPSVPPAAKRSWSAGSAHSPVPLAGETAAFGI